MFTILFTTLITENIILTKFFGISLLIGSFNKEKNVLKVAIYLITTVLISVIAAFFLNKYLIIQYNIEYLKTLLFVIVIMIISAIIKFVIKRYFKSFYQTINLDILNINCITLAIILLSMNMNYNLIELLINSLGSCIGYLFVLYIFEENMYKIRRNDTLKSFKGIPIGFILIGIIALIFARFMI